MVDNLILQCAGNTTLSIVGDKLIARRKNSETVYPMSKIQSFSFTEATLYNGGGKISFTLYESAHGFVHWGLGLSTSIGSDHTFAYKFKELENAKKIRDCITSYINQNSASSENPDVPASNKQVVSVVAEIRGLKALMDEGILTQEEFDAKKKQLLEI